MISAVLRALGVNMGRGGFNHEDPDFLDPANKLEDVIACRNASPIWGFKIPEFALSLDELAELLRHPVFVLTFRNPVSILDSAMTRGDADLSSGLNRISAYYQAMIRFAQNSDHPTVLVSYERAAADPRQFIDEIASALALTPTAHETENALGCITGDGGGYTHLPACWHHVDVVTWQQASQLISIEQAGGSFHDISLAGVCDTTDRDETYFRLDLEPEAPESDRWVQFLIDFGSGFDMLNTYNLKYPESSAICFRHEGSVRRVAFGTRRQHARIRRISIALPV